MRDREKIDKFIEDYIRDHLRDIILRVINTMISKTIIDNYDDFIKYSCFHTIKDCPKNEDLKLISHIAPFLLSQDNLSLWKTADENRTTFKIMNYYTKNEIRYTPQFGNKILESLVEELLSKNELFSSNIVYHINVGERKKEESIVVSYKKEGIHMEFEYLKKHLKMIRRHRKYVRYYCFCAGIYWRGIKHDLSKYSPTELKESVIWYNGKISPIIECKKHNNGISLAWLHHKGRNDHHYEYWQDNFDEIDDVLFNNTKKHLIMPYYAVLESVCDNLGAGKAYQGDEFSYLSEFEWFCKKTDTNIAMDPSNKAFVMKQLASLAIIEIENGTVTRKDLKKILRELSKDDYRHYYGISEKRFRSVKQYYKQAVEYRLKKKGVEGE